MDKKSAKQVTLEKALSLFTVYGYDREQAPQTQAESGFTGPSYYKHYKKRPSILASYNINPKTKQIILEKALILFSISGYDGVTMASIARDVGIKAPSLYKHYKSKQDIFDTILIEVAKRIHDAKNRLIVPLQAEITGVTAPQMQEKLERLSFDLLSFYLEDEYVSRFRRMLSIERYDNAQAEQLFQQIFMDDVLEMETDLFRKMMDAGQLRDEDPAVMALSFYSPLFLIICKADNSAVMPDEVQQTIHQLAQSFVVRYGR